MARNSLRFIQIENQKIFPKNEQLALEIQKRNAKQTKHVARIDEISGARFFSFCRYKAVFHETFIDTNEIRERVSEIS